MKKILVLFILGWMTVVSAETYLDEGAFTKRYVAVVMELHPEATATIVNELEVKIKLPDDRELIAYLNNAYADYKNDPGDIDNVLATYAQTVSLPTELDSSELGKERIFPVIKDKLYIQQVEEMFADSDKGGLVYEKLNDVLYVLYAFDTPKSIRFMTEDDLSEVGLKKSELRELSKSNLRNAIPNLGLEGNPASLAMLVADGMYEASFILFDGIWTKEQFPVKGDIVVYIPARDLVLITGSEDEAGLAKVHEIVYGVENQWSHVVADVGFVRVNNTWQTFQPE